MQYMRLDLPSRATIIWQRLARVRHARLALLIGALAGCGLIAVVVSTQSRPTQLVAGYNNYAPFTMPGPEGKPQGLAVEIVNRAAARAGVSLRWVLVGDNVDEVLRNGSVDLLPMLTLTKERIKEFHVSQPWWENETTLISLEKAAIRNDEGLPSLAVQTADKRIGIRGLAILRTLAEALFPNSKLVIIPEMGKLVESLCTGRVDAVFLDVRLLNSQLLRGLADCANHPLVAISVHGGSLSQGTVTRTAMAGAADRIYREIAQLALDGTLSETASRWSLVSSFQSRHMIDVIDANNREKLLRSGLAILTFALALAWFQNRRIRKAKAVAVESRQRFDAFMNHTPAVTFIRDAAGKVVYVNNAFHKPFQQQPESVIAQFGSARFGSLGAEALESGQSVEATETIRLPSGEERHFLSLTFPFSYDGGARFVGTVALDITERTNAEEALRFSQFSIERSPNSILWVDSACKIFYANGAAARMLGYTREELLLLKVGDIDQQRDWSGLLQTSTLQRLAQAIEGDTDQPGLVSVESRHRRKDASIVPVEMSLYYLELGGRDFTCCICRDITDRKKAECELAWQAEHDSLTGLPNRRHFESLLESRMGDARASGCGLAVFYFDLDGFKLINDTLGHSAGDALLKQLVRRLTSSVRAEDTLARMGGDEFTLIAPGVADETSALVVGAGLLGCLRESFLVDGHELTVTASFGISLFPLDGSEGTTLLQHADAAMYEAKRLGKNRLQRFDLSMNEVVRERLELENQLRRALAKNELSLHYQPEISLTSGMVVRHEALLRWNNPVLGNVSPVRFIPIAEETGLIVPIGEWVLQEACRHTQECLSAGSNAGVSVNVSSVQFARSDFVDTVVRALALTGLPAARLELELTETVVMQAIDVVAQKVSNLRQIGVGISIDDFGTGYSSLSYLRKLRIDGLKIDRSFIRDIPHDPNAVSLTRALVSLAHGLGMQVVVEGVETRDQLEAVRGMGCDTAQGYYLGRPVPGVVPVAGMAEVEAIQEVAPV